MKQISRGFGSSRGLAAALVALVAITGCSGEHAPTAPPATEDAAVEAAPATPAAEPAPAPAEAPAPALLKGKATNQGQLTAGQAVASCHLDNLSSGATQREAGQLKIARDQPFFAAGWVSTPDETAVPQTVSLRLLLDGSPGDLWDFTVPTGGDRTDVATFKGKPALATAGFSLDGDTSGMPAGLYHAYLSFEHAGQTYSCNGGDRILIE